MARLQRWGALTAPILAAAVVVPAAAALERDDESAQEVTSAASGGVARPAERAYARTVSRSGVRAEPPAPRMAVVDGLAEIAAEEEVSAAELSPRWVSVDLNVWTAPRDGSRLLTVLDPGDKVQVTGAVQGPWAQVAYRDRIAWVHRTYLMAEKPAATGSTAPVSGAPCPDGSAVESGLVANTVKVYRSVCAAFPTVSSWGGRSGSGDHGAGRALDIMVTGSLGDAIAAYVREHARELGVSEVIWSQRIWTVQRSSEGWRYMEDRGSTTANHYDHVHVSVY
jgi:hypothetical protein